MERGPLGEKTRVGGSSAGSGVPALVLRGLGAVALAAVAWLAREVLLLAFFALLIGIVFSFPVRLLARAVPRGVAVILVLLACGGAAAGLGVIAAPSLSRQLNQVSQTAPKTWAKVRGVIEQARAGAEVQGGQGSQGSAPVPGAAAKVAQEAAPALVTALGGLTKSVLVVVLAAFLAYEPDVYRRGIRRLVPQDREAAFDELWERLSRELRKWVGGILLSMLIMGTLAGLGLRIAGIENWLVLGVLTFLGTFVPYLGAVASAIPGLLVALAQSPRHFAYALIVYLGVHLVEGYIVQPLIMRRAVEIKPALLLLGQSTFGVVFGLAGILIATPAIACARVAVDYLWVQRRLGKAGPAGA